MHLEKIRSAALISDTHGYLNEQIVAAIKQCDIAIHAGDVGNADVIRAMQPRSGQVYLVKGNNDTAAKWPAQHRSVLSQLQDSIALDLPGGQLAVVHGHRQNPVAARHALLRKLYSSARLIVYGHSHRLCIDQQCAPWVVNPGAAGKARTYGGPGCLILHVSQTHWRLETVRISDS